MVNLERNGVEWGDIKWFWVAVVRDFNNIIDICIYN